MKALTLKTIAISTLLISSGFALANYPISAFEERQLVKICEAAKENHVGQLRRMVSKTAFNYKSLQKGITCNGLSLVDFAIKHNADNTAMYIAKKARLDPNVVIAKLNITTEGNAQSES